MSDSEYEYDDNESGLTSVLLGYTSKEASKSDLNVLGNHIGGIPVWLGDIAPSSSLLECKVCNRPLDLLAQLSCPLPGKDYDRVLYILSCSDPNCRRKEGSVRAIRGIESNDTVRQRIAQEIEESLPENNIAPKQGTLGDSLFSTNEANSNPFGQASSLPVSNNTSSKPKASKKKSKTKKDLRIVQGKYTCKLVDVDEEFIEFPEPTKQLEGIKIEQADTEPVSEGAAEAADVSSSAAKEFESRADPVFAHFVDIVGCNPDQVLRYERGLKPLLYNGTDGVAEKLKYLKDKILEVQLMPHLIAEVETDDMMLDGMEWGSIFVATDKEDTVPALDNNGIGYVEEWVAVQWE